MKAMTTKSVQLALNEAVVAWRRRDLTLARQIAERSLADDSEDAVLLAFLGMLCCQMSDLPAGVRYLRNAINHDPADVSSKINLATALIDLGQFAEAAVVASITNSESDPSNRLWRLRGFALQQNDDHVGAAHAYRALLTKVPDDFDAWNNLGNALSLSGDGVGSVEALRRAVVLRKDVAPARLNLAGALIDSGETDEAITVLHAAAADFPEDVKVFVELASLMRALYRDREALAALGVAAKLTPDDPEILVRLGEQQIIVHDHSSAESSFRYALQIDPSHAHAYVQLALMLDQLNRNKELPRLADEARVNGADRSVTDMIGLLVSLRAKDYEAGLSFLRKLPETLEPTRQAQWEGEIFDRLGDADQAFAAFSRVNQMMLEDGSNPADRSLVYLNAIRAEMSTVTREWLESWTKFDVVDVRRSPVFLVGFPRSGTTLLDTMLMGHSAIAVMEERPPLRRVEEKLESFDSIANLTTENIQILRDVYFESVLDHIDSNDSHKILIDKFPLHLNKVPLIKRIFPDARFILALRHPYDVVLSSFITSFRLNNAMANFLKLDSAGVLYDLSFSYWTKCRQLMNLSVIEVRYEDLVEDPDEQLRAVLDKLSLSWEAGALDHQKTVARRGAISSASYSQVSEPLYRRANGRWRRYKKHLQPVLPILSPWAAHFGYDVSDSKYKARSEQKPLND